MHFKILSWHVIKKIENAPYLFLKIIFVSARERTLGLPFSIHRAAFGHSGTTLQHWAEVQNELPYLSFLVPVKNDFVTTFSPAAHLK